MTELNDHLKLLFARASELFDKQNGAAGCATTRRGAIYMPRLRQRAAAARAARPRH